MIAASFLRFGRLSIRQSRNSPGDGANYPQLGFCRILTRARRSVKNAARTEMESPMISIARRIAQELKVEERQVAAAVDLLDAGSTVPFIARYRKEATGALDDTQLRNLEERLRYLRELEDRRKAILDSVKSQDKLTPQLEAEILGAESKSKLEDIYLPYKPKRRTKATIAREAGLAPLAADLLADPMRDPRAEAEKYIDEDKGVKTPEEALDGARAILVEQFSEKADLIGTLREAFWSRGRMVSKVRDGKAQEGAKYADYFDFFEPLTKLPSHRILALFRGEKEEMLDLALEPESAADAAAQGDANYERAIAASVGIADRGRPADKWLSDCARWAWRTRIKISLSVDLRARLWQNAEDQAVKVFAGNLRDLLLAAPGGPRATMGLDPGFRTGVKVAVVDATGKVVETGVIYPHEPQRRWDDALLALGRMCRLHKVELIAIGNGTASRETDKLAAELVAKLPEQKLIKIMVSEAGASVYSASAFAANELPELDVTLRGAVSIARRLQDPLAELVKIDPKSIGVGQYQHDLAEGKLSRSLDAVVEDCVNAVGVDLNTASAPLLARVSGLGANLAANVVAHRDANGRFRSRDQLKKVPRLGAKAFEQCAGFLRIRDGDDPLDASGVHPEAYPLVRRILAATKSDIRALIGDSKTLRGLSPKNFIDEIYGAPTVTDVLRELEKPGRDPRPEFKTATFQEGVEKLSDLKPGMVLEGVVTNVAAFGAFVDIGVHQDGLVHISAMSRSFIKDPREAAKPGDVVKVKVLEVDAARKRIALTMRLDDAFDAHSGRNAPQPERGLARNAPQAGKSTASREPSRPATGNAFSEAFARAGAPRDKSPRK
jgi:uncharacterized protein